MAAVCKFIVFILIIARDHVLSVNCDTGTVVPVEASGESGDSQIDA